MEKRRWEVWKNYGAGWEFHKRFSIRKLAKDRAKTMKAQGILVKVVDGKKMR